MLVSEGGLSDVRCAQVDPFPTTPESEPNSTRKSAQSITLPATVTGVVEETDEDWFRVELKAGQRLSAEVVALPLGRYLFDALVELFDVDGQRLAISDDSHLLRQDPVISFVAPQDGEYFLRIREAAFGGDLDSRYRIHLGHYPRPTVAYPAGVQVDEPTKVRLLGDATGPMEARSNCTHWLAQRVDTISARRGLTVLCEVTIEWFSERHGSRAQ